MLTDEQKEGLIAAYRKGMLGSTMADFIAAVEQAVRKECEADRRKELATVRAECEAEIAELDAEVKRLNEWADTFSDAQMKARRTGEAYQQELRDKLKAAEANAKDAARFRELLSELIAVWINGRKIHDGVPLPLRERIDAALVDQEKK